MAIQGVKMKLLVETRKNIYYFSDVIEFDFNKIARTITLKRGFADFEYITGITRFEIR